jgi:hypothetical protein
MNHIPKLRKAWQAINDALEDITEEEHDRLLKQGAQPATALHSLGELIAVFEEVVPPRITRAEINRRLGIHGYVLERGKGYFYFRSLGQEPDLVDSIVYGIHNLQQLTLRGWEYELKEKMEQTWNSQTNQRGEKTNEIN